MDPVVSLHYYAPVCAIINACIIPFIEGLEPFYALHRVGLLVLFTNAGMAFALNVSILVPSFPRICLSAVNAYLLVERWLRFFSSVPALVLSLLLLAWRKTL